MTAAATAANKKLYKILASPNKIAKSLNWNKLSGAVLAIHVGEKSIDLAVVSHPSSFQPIQPLPSIPIERETRDNKKFLKKNNLLELSHIAEDFKVCGLVVSWPVQKEGWCGASCGKVLHTLDQIVQDTAIASAARPACLWDGHHFSNTEDEWGRLSLYAEPTDRQVHVASKEQYRDEGMLAADVAKDFLKHHWPDLSYNLDPFNPERKRSFVGSRQKQQTSQKQQIDPCLYN